MYIYIYVQVTSKEPCLKNIVLDHIFLNIAHILSCLLLTSCNPSHLEIEHSCIINLNIYVEFTRSLLKYLFGLHAHLFRCLLLTSCNPSHLASVCTKYIYSFIWNTSTYITISSGYNTYTNWSLQSRGNIFSHVLNHNEIRMFVVTNMNHVRTIC